MQPERRPLFAAVAVFLVYYVAGIQAGAGVGYASQILPSNQSASTPSTVNCTWKYITQPLNHFGASEHTFQQRYCIYDKYWSEARDAGFKNAGNDMSPIFIYTGNESPIEPYVNNTGLMWKLGEKMRALLVFVEHRYEGESLPPLSDVDDCVTYGTTAQALADYRALVTSLKKQYSDANSPVIAFGGSYGGMLAGWARIVAPDVFTGSIASSAPVRMIMTGTTANYKGGWEAIARGISAAGGATDHCFTNFRSIQQLARFVSQTKYGLQVLNRAARRCPGSEFTSGQGLIEWGGISIFFMAEGNYPFPSNYIPLSMGIDFDFPAWPMRVGCAQGLDRDLGVKVHGNLSNVNYTVEMGAFKLRVDWEKITGHGNLSKEEIDESRIFDLVRGYTDFNGVLANISGKYVGNRSCYGAAHDRMLRRLASSVEGLIPHRQRASRRRRTMVSVPMPSGKDRGSAGVSVSVNVSANVCPPCDSCPPCPASTRDGVGNSTGAPRACTSDNNNNSDRPRSWGLITCNDNVNMSGVKVKGVGGDAFWPPSINGQPGSRDWSAASIKGPTDLLLKHPSCTQSFDENGLFGGPTQVHSWGDWIADYYHERNQSMYSNIVWSNGALDPWSGGGQYADGEAGVTGPLVQNLTADGSSVALAIPLAGHHLDLYFPTAGDPPAVIRAREVEEAMIRKWSQEHYNKPSAL